MIYFAKRCPGVAMIVVGSVMIAAGIPWTAYVYQLEATPLRDDGSLTWRMNNAISTSIGSELIVAVAIAIVVFGLILIGTGICFSADPCPPRKV